jgi:tripartite ATP-independent transporter DctM subunit
MVWFIGLVMTALLALGFHVATSMGVLAYIIGEFFSFMPLTGGFGQVAWSTNTSFLLVAAPLFIMMGELMLISGVADKMYRAIEKWITWLPGGLLHTNVAATALFAASSGSSAATAATIGKLAVPNLDRGKYNAPLFLGSLAAGGTLGILIPPSVNLIIYGVMTEISIPKLYLAALIPGIMMALLFSLTILIACVIRPEWGGVKQSFTWRERMEGLVDLVPPVGLSLVVIGSIYLGIATATEAAALGVVATMLLAWYHRSLSIRVLFGAFERTMRTICMIKLIVLTAFLLNFVLIGSGFTDTIADIVTSLNMSPLVTMLCIILFYLLLGTFMETMSMMIATVPIIVPIVIAIGYDPIWFGIILVILVELGMLSPPVGLNLLIIQQIRGKDQNDTLIGAIPFFIAMLVAIVILLIWPSLALWLPSIWRPIF